MNSHLRVAITDEELSQWADKRADDAGRLARELVQRRSEIGNLVIAAREFWDIHNDLSEESAALDKALDPFSNQVPYSDDPGTPSPTQRVATARSPTLEEEIEARATAAEATVTELQEALEKAAEALESISSPTQTDNLLWWQVQARDALSQIRSEK